MLIYDRYEDLFNYRGDNYKIVGCIFQHTNMQISYDGEKISLFSDYNFYLMIKDDLKKIFKIVNIFTIWIGNQSNRYGVTFSKSGELTEGYLSLGTINQDVSNLVNNLPELDVLSLACGDAMKLIQMINPPVTLKQINIMCSPTPNNVNDYLKYIVKVPADCIISCKAV